MTQISSSRNRPHGESVRQHYRSFMQDGRILLTGHSHQAWPDCAKDGVLEAFDDAAEHVDDKWSRAMAKANVLRADIAMSLGASASEIALAQNSHELVTRFLSLLPLKQRPRLVTTAGEFHSIDRQLRRLAEAGVEVIFVPVSPIATLAERMAENVDETTAAVLASTVLFQTAQIVPNLTAMVEAAHRVGARVLLDSYHAFKVVPRPLSELGPDPIFVTSGGYKYAQWGEGCCWLRVPPNENHRPIYTGWFSDFAGLDKTQGTTVTYGPSGAEQFAGSTYDPTSHYRAAKVVEFFNDQGWTEKALRAVSLHQTGLIISTATRAPISPMGENERAGFVAFSTPKAAALVTALRKEGIFADSRADIIRFGPAPYLHDQEIIHGIERFNTLLDSI